ncbi:MAG: hypothetical protein GC201_03835 [Alphaproteobacteria bacterium]|nr:hypothetical protein [Alphaproteobacteria bacterium]
MRATGLTALLALASALWTGGPAAQERAVRVRPAGQTDEASQQVRIAATTSDPDYGYRSSDPILLGGMAEHDFDRRLDNYFQLLRSPEGEPLTVVVGDTCCPFRPAGSADVMTLQVVDAGVDGDRPYRFYVNGFQSGTLYAPRGLLAARNREDLEAIDGALDNLRSGFVDGAINALKPLASAGDAMAQFHLGRILADRKDFRGAYEWFLKAAQAGHSVSQATVAHMLESGTGVAQDRKAASLWIQRAAANGNTGALMRLALQTLSGNPSAADLAKAAGMLQLAADLGDPAAQAAYGIMLIQGKGVAQNNFLGLMWLDLARKAGDPNAVDVYPRLSALHTAQTMARVEQMAEQWSQRNAPPPSVDEALVGLPARGKAPASP